MFIKYRPLHLDDLRECQQCMHAAPAYDEQAQAQLIELWRELLISQSANAAVMEDVLAPRGKRILWFCFKVFVSNDYVHYLKTDAPPFVSRQIAASWSKDASPLLTRQQIQIANCREGLNMLVLNSGAPAHMLTGTNMRIIADLLMDFTRYFCSGYRCNEFLEEFYTDFTCAWATGAGLSLRTDYTNVPWSRHTCPDDLCPRLYGTTAQEAQAHVGTLASTILRYQPPQFFFRPGEQQLLLHALLGDTDQELATELDLALVTVRKRWDGIYERVAQVTPELFLASEETLPSSRRGVEKKRRLLNYLWYHLEELRPLNPRMAPNFD